MALRALAAPGPVLILGGPGSGKTTLSLLKAKQLIPGLKPGQEILFLSFSRSAVHQVIARCSDVLTTEERRQISVKTYHAFCMDILRTHGRLLTIRQPRILYPRRERLLRSAFTGDDWSVERQRLAREDGLYAFDQFAISCADLLSRAGSVRHLLANRYPGIILDEFQDTNDAQWAVVQKLAQDSRLITLADPDQRIFDYDETVDPKRLDQLREFQNPAEFDLGTLNHRSADAGILGFADAVLRNRPLPDTPDVTVREGIYPNAFDATVHAALVWLLGASRQAGIAQPSVAVLCRTNVLVSQISQILRTEHTLRGTSYPPLNHDVAWDAELAAAAAAVVASILEWSSGDPQSEAAETLNAIAEFFDLKNANKPTASARTTATSFRTAADKARVGGAARIGAARYLIEAAAAGFQLSGRAASDWRRAQELLQGHKSLVEILSNSRLVRLFGARDEIGGALSDRWNADGSYGPARELVRRALDQAQLLSTQTDHRGVVLMNMHKSKGKEFDGVLLVERKWAGEFFNNREEPPYYPSRRLLRVAMTRARRKIVILRVSGAPALTGRYD